MNNNCQLSKTFKQTLYPFLKGKEQRRESHWKNKCIQQNLCFHFPTRLEERNMRVLKMEHFSQLNEQKQAEFEFMSLYLKEKLIRKEN